MIRSLKVSAVVLTLALTSSYSLAANKVVVIPMGGSDVSEQQLNEQRVWSGWISSDGSNSIEGLFTSIQHSIGFYSVELNIEGLNLVEKYVGSGFPMATASIMFASNSDTIGVSGMSYLTGDNNTIESPKVFFKIYNTANTLVDRDFIFHAKFPDSNPPAPAAGLSSAESSLPDGVVCETVGDITTCTIGETE